MYNRTAQRRSRTSLCGRSTRLLALLGCELASSKILESTHIGISAYYARGGTVSSLVVGNLSAYCSGVAISRTTRR